MLFTFLEANWISKVVWLCWIILSLSYQFHIYSGIRIFEDITNPKVRELFSLLSSNIWNATVALKFPMNFGAVRWSGLNQPASWSPSHFTVHQTSQQCFSLTTIQPEQCFQPSFRPANGANISCVIERPFNQVVGVYPIPWHSYGHIYTPYFSY